MKMVSSIKKMKWVCGLAVSFALALSAQVFAAGGSGRLYEENFDSGTAKGWTLGTGMSVTDQQLKPADNSEGVSLYTAQKFSGSYRFSAKMANWADGEDTDLCLIFNAADTENYYYFAVNGSVYDPASYSYTKQGVARLYKRSGGVDTLLASRENVIVNDGIGIEIACEGGLVSVAVTDNAGVVTKLFSGVPAGEFTEGFIGVRNKKGMGYVDEICVTALAGGTRVIPIDSSLTGWKTGGTVNYEEKEGKACISIPEGNGGSYALYEGLPVNQSYVLTAKVQTYGYGGGDAGEILFNGSSNADARCLYMVPAGGEKITFYENISGWNSMGVPDYTGFSGFNDQPFELVLEYDAEKNTVSVKLFKDGVLSVAFENVDQKTAQCGGMFGIGTYGGAAIKLSDIVVKIGNMKPVSVENQMLTQEGNPVTSLASAAGKPVVYSAEFMHNRYGEAVQGTMLLGIFDEQGILRQTEIQNFTSSWMPEKSVNREFVLSPEAGEGWKIKAFYWKDLDRMEPLIDVRHVY